MPAQAPLLAASLPLDTRALIEHLFERLDLGSGTCRLELEAEDGRLRRVWKHQALPVSALESRAGT